MKRGDSSSTVPSGPLPEVYPLFGRSSRESLLLYDSSSDWASRLLQESSRFWAHEIHTPPPSVFTTPPFSRERPVSQRVYRSDGKRPRDGAGLGSPLLVEPGALFWTDPLLEFRLLIQSSLKVSKLPSLLNRLACLSDWHKVLQDGGSVKDLPLGTDPALRPGASGIQVAEALRAVQMEIQELAQQLSAKALEELSREGLPGWRLDLSVLPSQPFRLDLISEMAAKSDDLDWRFPQECKRGLSLGVSPVLSDSLHYLPKSESVFHDTEFAAWGSSYRSAEESPEKVLELIAEDIALGIIAGGFSWKELCRVLRLSEDTPCPSPDSKSSQYIPGIAISRVGCIDESSESGEKWRLVFDGTAAGVNGQVWLPVLAETPGLLDGEAIFSYPTSQEDPFLGIKIDVRGAFKRLLLSRDQYPYTVFSIQGKWFYSKSTPMGMRASPYHWCRFNGLLHRLTKRISQTSLHASLMYIDDSLYAALKSEFGSVVGTILIFLCILGVPISWKKLEAGFFLDWVGFRLDFLSKRAYLSQARLDKIEKQMLDLSGQLRVSLKEFRNLTFRMVWVSQSFPMSKVFLHKFFAALHSKPAVEQGYIFNLDSLKPYFELWTQLIRAARVWHCPAIPSAPRELSVTRTDAAAESSGVFLGGWFAKSLTHFQAGKVSWFAFRLSTDFFPQAKSANNHLISAAEALAVAIAVALWGADILQSDSRVAVMGSKKWYSSSPNLAIALECLVRACFYRKVRLSLSWIPGKENALADALSRLTVDPQARSAFSWLHPESRALGRVSSQEVLSRILPELTPFLEPLRVGRWCSAGCASCRFEIS